MNSPDRCATSCIESGASIQGGCMASMRGYTHYTITLHSVLYNHSKHRREHTGPANSPSTLHNYTSVNCSCVKAVRNHKYLSSG